MTFLQNGGTRISISFACNNACEGILSALEARNMFSRNATQNRICIIKPGGDKSSGNGTDQVSHEYALGQECDKTGFRDSHGMFR